MRLRFEELVGRDDLVASLHEALTTVGAAALIGPTGSGKTYTALHYLERYDVTATWCTAQCAMPQAEGLRVVVVDGVGWPEHSPDRPLVVLAHDAPDDLPYPVFRLDPLPTATVAVALEAAGMDSNLAPHLNGSLLALQLVITSDGEVGLPADVDPLAVLLGWHWRHLDQSARYLWQISAAFQHEAMVPIARLRWLMGWEEERLAAALSALETAGPLSIVDDWVVVHARAELATFWKAPDLLPAAQRLVAAYRQPEVLQAQVEERGLGAVQRDLAALAHLLPHYDALHRLWRLLAAGDSTDVVLQVRERAHHQGDHDLRSACDEWLEDVPRLYTEAVWHYPTASSRILEGHSHRITDMLPLAAGTLLTTSHDGSLRLWDADTGQVRRVLLGHEGGVAGAIHLSPYHVVSGGLDNTLRLWDIRTGDLRRTLHGHEWPITALARVDDCHVISASADDTLRVWDVCRGETIRILKGHREPVAAVAVWDERHALSGSHDGTARLWNIQSGETVRVFEGHSDSVTCVAWTAQGQVVTGSSDKTIRLWDVETRTTLRLFGNHTWPIQGLLVWGGHHLISAADTIRVWDMANGVLVRTLDGHTRPVTALARLDQRYLASGSADTTVRLWDMHDANTTPPPAPHQDWVTAVVGLQAPYAASAGADNRLILWNIEQGAVAHSTQAHEDGIYALVNMEGGNLVTASADHTLRVWHWALDENGPILKGHSDEVTTAAVLNAQYLISGSADQTLRVWDCWAGECLQVLTGHPARITAVTVLDEQQVVVGDALGNIWRWDLAQAAVVQRFSGYAGAVAALAVVGDTLWAAGHDHTVRRWHLTSGQAQEGLVGHQDWVTALAPMEGAPLLVSASFDGTLRLWDTQQGAMLTCLDLGAPLLSLAYLGRGRLWVGAANGTVRVIGIRLPQ